MRFRRQAYTLLAVLALAPFGACHSASPVFLVIPNAVHIDGAPSGEQTADQRPVVAPPDDALLGTGDTVVWTVDVRAVVGIQVNVVTIVTGEDDGYFVVPMTPDERSNGIVEVPMSVTTEETATVCNRDYRGVGTCYGPIDVGTTDVAFRAANDPDPATPGTGAGLSWGEPYVAPLTVQRPKRVDPPNYGECSAETPLGCGCTSMEACCETSLAGPSCGYLVNGTVWFPCDGADCAAAAGQVANYCVC